MFSVNFKELVTRDDLKGAVQELRVELGSVRNDLETKIANAWTELKSEIREVEQRLNAKIDNIAAKIFGEMTLLKWMVTLSITLNVAVLLRLFLGRSF